ncbi:MAG: group III truncated hemoglobin [Myxococcota bacterium]
MFAPATIAETATFTPEAIQAMVHAFYDRVRHDPLLAPVFDRRITDWGPHLQRMTAFWSSVLRGTSDFRPSPRGGPPVLHRAIAELTPEHFERWLALFESVVRERFTPGAADHVLRRAHRMGRALSAHL